MKALKWQEYLAGQSRVHGKTIFTVTELANIACMSAHALNVQLARLVERGVIQRYSSGKYGLPNMVTPEDLVKNLDSHAYITSVSALHYHQLITQIPNQFTCFTNRRHNRSRERMTPLGRYVFVCVSKSVYFQPERKPIASPEQAMFDFVYLMRRKGVDPKTIVTFRNLERLDESQISQVSHRYPKTVRKEVRNILRIENERG
jgi:hypothetical protein